MMQRSQAELDGERMGRLLQKVESLEHEVENLQRKVDELVVIAHRWRGAFVLILGIGGFLGWLLSVLPRWK